MTTPFTWVDFIPAIKQSIDKNGFLLCKDVPVARTGIQLYGRGETPLDPVTGDVVYIDREESEVFHPDCLASLWGAPVVNDHPTDGYGNRCDVTPDNWRQLAVGHVENPRRGDGIYTDFILADLRIHDRDAIDLIKSGKRQVSAGYDADYEETGPNRGRQMNIRANHVALVDNARCGAMCSIGDEAYFSQEAEMAVKGVTWSDRIRKAFKSRDQEELESALSDAEEGEGEGEAEPAKPNGGTEHHIHVHPPAVTAGAEGGDQKEDNTITISPEEVEELWNANQAEMDAISKLASAVGGDSPKFRDSYPHRDARRRRMGIDSKPRDQEEKEDEDKDTEDAEGAANLGGGTRPILREFEMEAPAGSQVVDVRKARDSRYLEESWADTIAKGELIVPGARPRGTFDRAAPREATYDAICGFRRSVLDMAYVQPATRAVIDSFTRGRFTTAGKLACGRVREVFDHVAEVKRLTNNTGGGERRIAADNTMAPSAPGGITSLAAMQKHLDEYYTTKK